jgi:hypothetical protein
MSDGTPAPEIQFKPGEALHFGGETTIGSLSPEMQKFKDRGSQLRKERVSDPNNPKKVFEAAKNRPREKVLTKQDKEDLDLKFGAGEAKRNPATKKVEMPAGADPEKKALFDEEQAELQNINNLIQYSEIISEAKKPGKTIISVLSERAAKNIDGPRDQAQFVAQRDSALDYILDTDMIRDGIPELATIMTPADKRKFIEETLAADPALRTKIVEKTKVIAGNAKALKEAPVNEEVRTAEDSKKEAETKKTENLTLVKNKLKELGFDDTRAEQLRIDVEKFARDGKSAEEISDYLRSESLSKLGDLSSVQEFIDANKQFNKAYQGLMELGSQSSPSKVVKENLEKQYQRAKETMDRLGGDKTLMTQLESFNKIARAFESQKDSMSTGDEGSKPLSPLVNGIDQVVKSQKVSADAEKTIKEKGEQNKQANEAWKVNRLVEESNLVAEMKNVIQSSVAEVLEERHVEMTALEKQRMERVAKEEEAKGNTAVAVHIREVEKTKSENWIKLNESTRKREVDTRKIYEDMKQMAYGKNQDGLKRLILRDAGLAVKDASGNVIRWQDVDVDNLPENVKKIFDKVYEAQKDSYAKKIFSDYFSAKSYVNRRVFGISLGALALKQHEYSSLQEKYGDAFGKGADTKKEIAEKLKAKGIKMNGGLLFLLSLLLAGPVVGAKKITGIGQA